MESRYLRLPSHHLDRRVHMWTFGWWGTPVLVFPTSSGMAHEWQAAGAVDALAPLIDAGRIKLYCPESNVSQSWRSDDPPDQRVARHLAYERFILDELVPWIRQDCQTPNIRMATTGASLGALYAATMALKHPDLFEWALCLSGRYQADIFLDGYAAAETWFLHPLAFVPGLRGDALRRVRNQTHLVLVAGRGNYEANCAAETHKLADALQERGISHERDLWGLDVSHDWTWWKRQLRYHLVRRYG